MIACWLGAFYVTVGKLNKSYGNNSKVIFAFLGSDLNSMSPCTLRFLASRRIFITLQSTYSIEPMHGIYENSIGHKI